jgi:ADP-ribosylation factor protein 1
MSSIISDWISKLFPAKEYRALMIGLDAAGKTSILYKMKLGEIVTTIPTIGFNVETIDYKSHNFTLWDVGGCDKIRPLLRHYYQNTQVAIFVVDSNDRERVAYSADSIYVSDDPYSNMKGLFIETMKSEELKDTIVLIYLNKQDLPNAMTSAEFEKILNYEGLVKDGIITRRKGFHIQPCCASTGEGLYEGLDWLVETMKNPSFSVPSEQVKAKSVDKEKEEESTLSPQEKLLSEWLAREDDPDNLFLEKFSNYSLDSWDHYTHLRIAWIYLTRYSRQQAMPLIFNGIRSFIENSPRTKPSAANNNRGTTFHETMTYFWVHVVHYAIIATKLPENTFKTFLVMNPQLSNGGLFLEYYTKDTMLMNPQSRKEVMLPDKKSLPSIIALPTSTASKSISSELNKLKLTNDNDMNDSEFYHLFRSKELSSFGHETKLRLMYLYLCYYGRGKGGVDRILELLEFLDNSYCQDTYIDVKRKKAFHLTLNYFWIQMITYHMMNLIKISKTKESSSSSSSSIFSSIFGSKASGEDEGKSLWKKENFGNMFPSSSASTSSHSQTVMMIGGIGNQKHHKDFKEFIYEKSCSELLNPLLYEK